MKKKLLSILLSLAMLLTVLPMASLTTYAATDSGMCGENASYTLDENGTLRITGSGLVDNPAWEDYKDQIIRLEVNGPSELGDHLFSDYLNLETVVLGNSVEEIGDYCFLARNYGTSSIESIQLGTGLRRIGVGAFTGARNLKQVIINDLDSWCLVEIDHYSDKSASNEASTPLYYGADLILNGAPVTEVVFPDGLERISAYAFAYCKSLEKVTIPASVKSIGVFAFAETPNLESVTFLGSAPEPDFDLFEGRISYASGIFYAQRTSVGRKIVIQHPEGDASYTNRIRFLYSTNYMAEDVPGEDPNEDWPDLFLISTDSYFANRVTWPEPDPNLIAHGGCGEDMTWKLDKEGVLTISGTGEMDCYSYVYGWGNYSYDIKKVEIPDGVTSIDSYAFMGCQYITDITIPDSVTDIAEVAFAFCRSLKEVTIPNGITEIKNDTFFGCSGLTNVTIPDTVTSIGDSAFSGCSELKEVMIPASVTTIEDNAFGYEWAEKIEDFVIIGHDATEAQRYAVDNDITFIK